jgi:hypothetical protein
VSRAVALVAALSVSLLLVAPASAAAPDYVLVTGPGLKRPVLLPDWSENHMLLLAAFNAPRAKANVVRGLARRPRLDLAVFWAWGGRPRPTRPNEANQRGWFYPARRARPAVIGFPSGFGGVLVPRVAPAEALRILARRGVPTRP